MHLFLVANLVTASETIPETIAKEASFKAMKEDMKMLWVLFDQKSKEKHMRSL